MTTNTVKLVKVEDHEGNGTCGQCDREGLRWIAVLSDGEPGIPWTSPVVQPAGLT